MFETALEMCFCGTKLYPAIMFFPSPTPIHVSNIEEVQYVKYYLCYSPGGIIFRYVMGELLFQGGTNRGGNYYSKLSAGGENVVLMPF